MAGGRVLIDRGAAVAVGDRPRPYAVFIAHGQMQLADGGRRAGAPCSLDVHPRPVRKLLHADKDLVNAVHIQIGTDLEPCVVQRIRIAELDADLVRDRVSLGGSLDVGKVEIHSQLVCLGVIRLHVRREPFAVAGEGNGLLGCRLGQYGRNQSQKDRCRQQQAEQSFHSVSSLIFAVCALRWV